MEKSIESIWKKGFDDEKSLSSPKINRHHYKKSKLVIEKLNRVMKIDNMGLIPFAILLLAGFSYYGFVILGSFLFIVIICIYILNKRVLNNINKVNIKFSTNEYLTSFRSAITKTQKLYTKAAGIGLPPIAIISYWLFFREFEKYHLLIDKLSSFTIISIVVTVGVILSLFGIIVYKLSVKLVYGFLLEKLDRIIADIEGLQKD